MKKVVATLYLLLVLALGLSLFYYLPATNKVYLVGTEVKREVRVGSKGEQMKDVRYVVARDIPSGKTLMFRNEDMPWPPYLKFDSGDLSGKVMNLEEHNPESAVFVTYYGFRIPILSMYPNVTSIEAKGKKFWGVAVLNWIAWTAFVLLSLAGQVLILRKFRKQAKTEGVAQR